MVGEQSKGAKPGSLLTVSKKSDISLDAIGFFAQISNFGKKKHSLLIEFKDKTIGTADPALVITGKGSEFKITALTDNGKKILQYVKGNFSFAEKVRYSKDTLSGIIPSQSKVITQEQIMKSRSHLDVMRSIVFAFKQLSESEDGVAGLYGMVGYDLADPTQQMDATENSYIMYFVDNAFVIDHTSKESSFVTTAIITDNSKSVYDIADKKIKWYEKLAEKKLAKMPKAKQKKAITSYDIEDTEYISAIKEIRKQIVHGSVIQLNPSRLVTIKVPAEPLSIYQETRSSTAGYSFYVSTEDSVFMGSQPSLQLTVSNNGEKEVSLTTISTARPRGYENGRIDLDLDAKKEVRIWADENEMIEHLITIDASRNIVSEIAKAGTCHVEKMFAIEKQDQYQYMYATVQGLLKDNYDALHALQVSLGISAGIPKQNAMSMLKSIERTKRGMFGGSFIHVHPDGTIKSMLLEPIQFKKDTLTFRTSVSVTHHGNYPTDMQKSQREEDTVLNFVMKAGAQR